MIAINMRNKEGEEHSALGEKMIHLFGFEMEMFNTFKLSSYRVDRKVL